MKTIKSKGKKPPKTKSKIIPAKKGKASKSNNLKIIDGKDMSEKQRLELFKLNDHYEKTKDLPTI